MSNRVSNHPASCDSASYLEVAKSLSLRSDPLSRDAHSAIYALHEERLRLEKALAVATKMFAKVERELQRHREKANHV